ncbi:hypothetical protein [Zoogloea sp. LCSB751]|uniref:hypothetical protein n=1 Tax=Zoogloea sp. LCSB751 TaxID=1965277 RepID=UPI0009A4B6B9|nr:hypothetical protein [Zoogloea sp. LCSB751]
MMFQKQKQDPAREQIRAVLEPIKQALMTEVGKIQAEIRGGTEALGEVQQFQNQQFKLINDVLEQLKVLDARVTKLEARAAVEALTAD